MRWDPKQPQGSREELDMYEYANGLGSGEREK